MDWSKLLELGTGKWQKLYDRSPLLFTVAVIFAATFFILLFWAGIYAGQNLIEMLIPVEFEVMQ